MANERHFTGGEWALMVYAAIIGLIGLALLAGGIWLIILGGVVYYAIAGIGLLAASVLFFGERIAGLWIYFLTYVFTLIWGFAEVGLHPWRLVPWVVGPTILLIVSLLFVPVLLNGPARRTMEAAR